MQLVMSFDISEANARVMADSCAYTWLKILAIDANLRCRQKRVE